MGSLFAKFISFSTDYAAESSKRRCKKYPHHDPRWSLIRSSQAIATDRYQHCEHIARVLLADGIVFRKLLDQEDILPA